MRGIDTTLGTDALDRLAHLNYVDFFRESMRFAPASVVVEEGGVLLWASASDFPVFANGVARVDDAVRAADVLAAAHDFFGTRRRGFTAFARSTPADEDLVHALEEADVTRLLDSPEMICPARLEDRPPASGVELRRVADPEGVRDLVAVNSEAYTSLGMPADRVREAFADPRPVLAPHLAAYVAYLDGAPTSTAMANLSHGIGGVYWVGTLESARHHGLADTCTRAVTNWAFDRGAAAVSLQASPMGEPIYRRMGYEERYRYYGYVAFV